MNRNERAKQFMPFSALKGYEELVEEQTLPHPTSSKQSAQKNSTPEKLQTEWEDYTDSVASFPIPTSSPLTSSSAIPLCTTHCHTTPSLGTTRPHSVTSPQINVNTPIFSALDTLPASIRNALMTAITDDINF